MKKNIIACAALIFVVHAYGKFEKHVGHRTQINDFATACNLLIDPQNDGPLSRYDDFVNLRRRMQRATALSDDLDYEVAQEYNTLTRFINDKIAEAKENIKRSTQTDLNALRRKARLLSSSVQDVQDALKDVEQYRMRNRRQITIAGSQFIKGFADLNDELTTKIEGVTALKTHMAEQLNNFKEAYAGARGNAQALSALRDGMNTYFAQENQNLLSASDEPEKFDLTELRARIAGDIRALGGPLEEPRIRRRLDFGLPAQGVAASGSE